VHELSDAGLGRYQKQKVVEWQRADEVEKEPRAEIMARDQARLQDYLVSSIRHHHTYTVPTYTHASPCLWCVLRTHRMDLDSALITKAKLCLRSGDMSLFFLQFQEEIKPIKMSSTYDVDK